jgi:transposase
MLIIGYVFAIRSERAICRDVQVNLAYRWFCGLSIEDKIPDHSAFSRARHERFRDSDMFRRVFDRVVEACIAAGLVGGAQKISERTRAGMARARAQGKRIGRPAISGKLRDQIAGRMAAGETPYAVAKALGIDRHTAAKYA